MKPADPRSPLSVVLYVVAALIVAVVVASAVYGQVNGHRDADKIVNNIEQSSNG